MTLRDALITALCTAGYTPTDGAGARAAGMCWDIPCGCLRSMGR
ncbi:hypothetical protein O0544_22460 [Edwardsiella anguillarum]|nr:hypothetical protein [Edwardsiella anguillarum]